MYPQYEADPDRRGIWQGVEKEEMWQENIRPGRMEEMLARKPWEGGTDADHLVGRYLASLYLA